ncbi:MAG: helix-turn-helix domain-containing protein [Candidatus Binatia bacterium]
MEETLTPSEVAAFFKIHLNTVYRLANRGIIPGYKVGRGWRFHKTDMVRVLSRQQRRVSKANHRGLRKGQGNLPSPLRS